MADNLAPPRDVVLFTDKNALSLDAAHRFVSLAAQQTQSGCNFNVALAGGSTPALLYGLLANPPFRSAVAWAHVHLFFGDERCVAPDSADSNFLMVQKSGLTELVPHGNLHRMHGEMPDHDKATHQAEQVLRAFLGANGLPRFDLILLGMGSDGHCASLFPHKPSLRETNRLIVASEPGLKPFVPRLTLTLPVLNAAANVLFLVAGGDKAETLVRVLEGPDDPDALPSQSVRPTEGTLTWLLDREAAANLKTRNRQD